MSQEIIKETIDGKNDSSSDFKIKREKEVFYVGQRFSSLEEMEQTKNKYEDDHFCE